MAQVDLVCSKCKKAFEVTTFSPLTKEQKRCPECSSDTVRQTFASYVRNGPVFDPHWGQRGGCSTYG